MPQAIGRPVAWTASEDFLEEYGEDAAERLLYVAQAFNAMTEALAIAMLMLHLPMWKAQPHRKEQPTTYTYRGLGQFCLPVYTDQAHGGLHSLGYSLRKRLAILRATVTTRSG